MTTTATLHNNSTNVPSEERVGRVDANKWLMRYDKCLRNIDGSFDWSLVRKLFGITSYSLGHRIFNTLERALREETTRARSRATDNLRDSLAHVAEQQHARYGWVYVRTGRSTFRSFASFHTDHGDLSFDSERDNCIGSLVAKTGKPYVSNDLKRCGYFRRILHDTTSQLTVPILSHKDEVIGIVTLEATNGHRFPKSAKMQVADVARKMLVDTILLQNLIKSQNCFCPWHPGVHGWSGHILTKVMCEAISEAIDRNTTTALVWSNDIANEDTYILETARDDDDTHSASFFLQNSPIGQVLTHSPGAVTRMTLAELARHDQKCKAHALGLRCILATSIRNNVESESNCGVLCIYSFARVPDLDLPSDETMRSISRMLSRYLARINLLKRNAALAELHEISSRRTDKDEIVENIRKLAKRLSTILSAEGAAVGIYCVRNERPSIRYLIRTGLASEEKKALTDAMSRQTVYAIKTERAMIRSNYANQEPASGSNHRVMTAIPSVTTIGTITVQLVRSSDARPFSQSEEDLLKQLATVFCKPVVSASGILESTSDELDSSQRHFWNRSSARSV